MKHVLSIVLLLVSVLAFANDGVYYTSGNMLVPMRESTISVRKEILTITISKDNRAIVDVYYEFYNPDTAKTVSMAFEASAPDNAPFDISKSIEHPYIHDFKVVMNDKLLAYKNMLIASRFESNNEVIPLDVKEWKHEIPKNYEEDGFWPNQLYNARLDSVIYADFGYMFEATFKHGVNIVHHTYSYDMSISIGYKYSVHYWLTPATRWANGQIDDFTLRIRNENNMDFFVSNDSLFSASPFVYAEGNGTLYPFTDEYNQHHTLFVNNGKEAVMEWHAMNFAPKSNMCLYSIDYFMPWMNPYMAATEGKVVVDEDGMVCRYIGDSGDNYLVETQDYGLVPKSNSRIETYSARNGQGILTIKNKEYKSVNIHKEPSTKSAIVTKIRDKRGELPVVMKCLGMTEKPDNEWNWWIKVEVNGKVGYVRWNLVMWDSIDTF